MKYDYNGRTITLDDELTVRYKEMNGGLADLDIDIFLDNEKITHPDFNINNVTDEELSIIVKKQMGYSKVVYRGIAKNMHRFNMLFASANLIMCSRAGRTKDFVGCTV